MKNMSRTLMTLALMSMTAGVFAQVNAGASASGSVGTPATGVAAEEQFQVRDARQQQKVEQGLQSGDLSVKQAGQLERREAHIEKMEAHDLKNGPITAQEQANINAAQNREYGALKRDESAGAINNPNSRSAQRMQKDVQRDADQDRRIANGVKDGQLNERQAARLDAGAAHVDAKESVDARN
jgi:hypothetical protein